MTFIPNNDRISVGDRVRLNRDVTVLAGTFTKGHEFKVEQISGPVVHLIDDEGRGLNDIEPLIVEKIKK